MALLNVEGLVKSLSAAVAVLCVAGLVVHAFLIVARLAGWSIGEEALGSGDPYVVYAVPISAVAAFGIVVLLNLATASKEVDNLSFKAFGLEFSGPAAPVTLWVVVFLALVLAVRLRPAVEGQTSPAAIKSSGGAVEGGPNAQPPLKT